MKSVSILIPAALASLALAGSSDPLAPRPNGMANARPTGYLITNATVHTAPGSILLNTDIRILDGRITEIGANLDADGFQAVNIADAHVYSGFIDSYVPIETSAPEPGAPGTHWNRFVTPQSDALETGLPTETAKDLRELGFTTAMIAPDHGVFRGWSAIVSTAEPFSDPSMGATPIHKAHAAQMHGFDKTSWQDAAYPTSHMGIMALLRQTFIDAEHRAATQHTDTSCLDQVSAEHLNIYDTDHELEALLTGEVATEFSHEHTVIVGNGAEHRRLAAFKGMGFPVIVPLNFPKTPDVSSVGAADSVDLAALQSWERAPANARWLDNSGITVALTSSKLPDGQDFWDNLHTAIEKGLKPSAALAMLTTNPATILGIQRQGRITNGLIANLVIADGDLFDPQANAKIIDLFIDGRPHHINDESNTRFDGHWTITLVGSGFQLAMTIEDDHITLISAQPDGSSIFYDAREVSIDHNQISFLADDQGTDGVNIITGVLSPDGTIHGSGLNPAQQPFQWTAARSNIEHDSLPETDEENDDSETNTLPDLPTAPFGPYAYPEPLDSGITLITNATIWTQADDSTLEDAWIILRDNKIMSLGTSGIPRIAVDRTIDAAGMHITPGLIDAHSHTGLFRFGVNESGQAVTSEVRIADSLDPAHPGFYRELAGGLTTAMLLHGSANPIGGQSQTIKLRWGSTKPTDMHFVGAKPGIKFALGENVKQSNWGDKHTTRYPQTRMGVETLMRDRFTKAHEYAANRGEYEKVITKLEQTGKRAVESIKSKSTESVKTDAHFEYTIENPELIPPRDLELETLAQILAGERLVHCHSYRQDEILMLCRIAEEFNFTIGTFQHGLETYKVAEIVKQHAIGTSIFSDWGAYKAEVQDAIPYAGPINHEVGLLTSYNSDSDDLARRMHAEAGKAYKYAKMSGIEMSQQDALNFVTKNPAIQLGIIDRVGTLEAGKDADLAIWTGNPLSSLSRCEMTFIDGKLMFSRDQDAEMRKAIAAERQRIIQMILTMGPDKKDDDEDDDSSEDEHHHPEYTTTDSNSEQGTCGCTHN